MARLPTHDEHSDRERGPFRADQLREGDRYELSRGHPVYCQPAGGRGAGTNLAGGEVLDTDPDVDSAGVDAGYSPAPDVLRAPDVAVGNVPNEPGWIKGAPLLALEYADTGPEASRRRASLSVDEAKLQQKIRDLLEAGTKLVWVARLIGPRRVEVYEAGQPMRLAVTGEELAAPGGRAEGKTEGRAEALLAIFAARGLAVTAEERGRVLACRDLRALEGWIARAVDRPRVGADEPHVQASAIP